MIKCYKQLFDIEGLKNNIGNYTIGSIIIITLILSILFKIKGYNIIKNRIYEIIKNINDANRIKNNPPKIKNIKKKKKSKKLNDINYLFILLKLNYFFQK